MLYENASDAQQFATATHILGHPYLVSLLFIPSLYATFLNSKNFIFTCIFEGRGGLLSHLEFLLLVAAALLVFQTVSRQAYFSLRRQDMFPVSFVWFLQYSVNSVESKHASHCSTVCNQRQVVCERHLSLVAIHNFPWEVFHCTKNYVWSFAALHIADNRTINRASNT